jgi:hypothetical protein
VCASIALLGALAPAFAGGVAVQMTPEMAAAGIVSSGVALPPIPPATGKLERGHPNSTLPHVRLDDMHWICIMR